jgi:hypothetical protein
VAARSLAAYRQARDAWATLAKRAERIYAKDISYGDNSIRRGHWSDRLPEIERDVLALEKYFAGKPVPQSPAQRPLPQYPKSFLRPTIAVEHIVPQPFHPGGDLSLTLTVPTTVTVSTLWYRHVNHGERWSSTPMKQSGKAHTASIPGSYTDSPYPLQYYFEIHTETAAILHPSFLPTLSNQPYYAIMATT